MSFLHIWSPTNRLELQIINYFQQFQQKFVQKVARRVLDSRDYSKLFTHITESLKDTKIYFYSDTCPIFSISTSKYWTPKHNKAEEKEKHAEKTYSSLSHKICCECKFNQNVIRIKFSPRYISIVIAMILYHR